MERDDYVRRVAFLGGRPIRRDMAMRRGLVGLLLAAGAVAVLSTVPAGPKRIPALPTTDPGDVAVATSLPPTTSLPTTSLPTTVVADHHVVRPPPPRRRRSRRPFAGHRSGGAHRTAGLPAELSRLLHPTGPGRELLDIDAANFSVIGGDPYGLDNGGVAGVACEDGPTAAAPTPAPTTPPTQVTGHGRRRPRRHRPRPCRSPAPGPPCWPCSDSSCWRSAWRSSPWAGTWRTRSPGDYAAASPTPTRTAPVRSSCSG